MEDAYWGGGVEVGLIPREKKRSGDRVPGRGDRSIIRGKVYEWGGSVGMVGVIWIVSDGAVFGGVIVGVDELVGCPLRNRYITLSSGC